MHAIFAINHKKVGIEVLFIVSISKKKTVGLVLMFDMFYHNHQATYQNYT